METIMEAIRNRQVLLVEYGGVPGAREIEPHACGVSRVGNEVVRAFQVDGPSRSGRTTGWKLMRLDNIQSLEVSGETFEETRPHYARGDKHMIVIHEQL